MTLAGDGSTINYCELPKLDGSGKRAADIPKGNTPGCGYEHFPLPILAECTEPLVEGADDIRGLWAADGTGKDPWVGHVERIEQCGNRTVVTTQGIIPTTGLGIYVWTRRTSKCSGTSGRQSLVAARCNPSS